MNGQLLICDQIELLQMEGLYCLGKVFNEMTIPVLPYAVRINLFIKIYNFERIDELETKIYVHDPSDSIIATTSSFILRNYRKDDQVPGVDTMVTMTFPISSYGIYLFNMVVNNTSIATYPMTFRLGENIQIQSEFDRYALNNK